jgi:hypothetical protein
MNGTGEAADYNPRVSIQLVLVLHLHTSLYRPYLFYCAQLLLFIY